MWRPSIPLSEMSSVSDTSLLVILSAFPGSTVTNILLGALVLVAAAAYTFYCASPMRLTRILVAAISAAEKKYFDAIEDGVLSRSDVQTAEKIASLQIKVSNIREDTLRNSLSYRTSFYAFLKGRTFTILYCIRDVRTLETHIEILKEVRLRAFEPDLPTSESATRTVSVRQRPLKIQRV
ncbi:hypothetical protein FB451DRAFT_1551420 [Mycena latifolia]|nr:hypothetical protein FB451DRAFT_1551420 [Mycena latifolia]